MAVATIVIPGAITKLADGVVVNPATVTAQNLFQMPLGLKGIVTGLVMRDPNGTVLATSTWSAGFGAAATTVATNVVSASQTCVAQAAGTDYVQYVVGVATAAVSGAAALTITPTNGAAEGLPSQYFNITFAGTPGTATVLKVDVYGYLEAN